MQTKYQCPQKLKFPCSGAGKAIKTNSKYHIISDGAQWKNKGKVGLRKLVLFSFRGACEGAFHGRLEQVIHKQSLGKVFQTREIHGAKSGYG